mmetsp:Transcript_7972/g.13380  ORF Transcript_7972/g.13380 Transcript_7972/m.13380 type:complete len:120 (+) Transcript_7972:1259-1618(+)
MFNQQNIEILSHFDQLTSQNFQTLSREGAKNYQLLAKQFGNLTQLFLSPIKKIGQLQLLRRLVVRQINFAAKVECSQYSSCLEAVNTSILTNYAEIKENSQRFYLDRDQPDIAALLDNQ